MTAGADRWIRWTTIACVALLALIAGTVSYLHMHALVARHGQPGWVAALTPFSVDGMIVAASTTLLADSRAGERGGKLPWALLVAGSVASLAANVAVAEPTLIGRVIAAWPSFALTASYELLTRQVRCSSTQPGASGRRPQGLRAPVAAPAKPVPGSAAELRLVRPPELGQGSGNPAGTDLQRRAWQWALAHRASDGNLPSGRAIAAAHGRHERWGRLVKKAGRAGTLGPAGASQATAPHSEPGQATATGAEGAR
jgi:hypothetical protein